MDSFLFLQAWLWVFRQSDVRTLRQEESGYLEMESELFVLRQGSRNLLTYLYLFGDGKRFDGLPEHDLSGILMAQAEHTYLTTIRQTHSA